MCSSLGTEKRPWHGGHTSSPVNGRANFLISASLVGKNGVWGLNVPSSYHRKGVLSLSKGLRSHQHFFCYSTSVLGTWRYSKHLTIQSKHALASGSPVSAWRSVDLLVIFLALVGARYTVRRVSFACDICLWFDLLWFWQCRNVLFLWS